MSKGFISNAYATARRSLDESGPVEKLVGRTFIFVVVLTYLVYEAFGDAIRMRRISYARTHLDAVGVRWRDVQSVVSTGLPAQQVRYLRKAFTSSRIAYTRYALKAGVLE